MAAEARPSSVAARWARGAVVALGDRLTGLAGPERATAMARYMRDQFGFFGVPATARRAAQHEVFGALQAPDRPALLAFAEAAWERREREFQYVAADLLRRNQRLLMSEDLDALRMLVTTKSWWDTVDELAVVVGAVVRRDPAARSVLDGWLKDDDIWLVRVAILHQERWKGDTDADWLFDACHRHASHREFFVRKAIGWALRSYAKVEPEAVALFLTRCGDELAGLSVREARRGIALGLARTRG